MPSIVQRPLVRLLSLVLTWLVVCLPLAAQEPPAEEQPAKRLIEREPYDQITVKDAAGAPTTLKIAQLDETALPGRRRPEKLPATPLVVRLVDRPDEPRQVAWRDIVKLELFEELVLAEAEQLVAEKKTDEAFEHFDLLVRSYPNTVGLEKALQMYLYVDAGRLFGERRYTEALAVLEELHRQNKDFRVETPGRVVTVQDALSGVVDKLLEDYVGKQNYAPARTLLARLERKFKGLPSQAKWQTVLIERAVARREEARAHLAAGRGRTARDTARQMTDIWPNVEGGKELIGQIARAFPLVIVGVTRTAPAGDARDMLNWPVRRTGRLLERNLVEYAGQGPEGGRYECPLGKLSLSEDGKQLVFRLQKAPPGGALPPLTGYEVSQRLLALADPNGVDYLPAWARLVSGVEVNNVMQVSVDFRRTFVSPQALLQIPLEGSFGSTGGGTGPYIAAEPGASDTGAVERSFLPNPRYPSRQPPRAEIVERQYESPYRALAALRRGEIDVLDRLFPADVPRLKDDASLLVGRYELPTVHMLLFNAKRPYLANRTFRRALIYAIDRRAILDQGLLNGASVPGCQVVSGPFSAGISDSDPGGYAYNRRIEPRPYDPRLATILVRLAEQEVEALAKDRNETPPPRPKLVLAHPADEVPRIACGAIVSQFKTIGLACELKELPAGEVNDPDENYDLLYVEAMLPEPAIDAGKLLGAGSVAMAGGTHVAFALRQLDAARNWQEARKRLVDLHTMTHDEAALVPLWQLVEHYAHQASLRGLGTKAAAFYQDVEQWQVVPRAN